MLYEWRIAYLAIHISGSNWQGCRLISDLFQKLFGLGWLKSALSSLFLPKLKYVIEKY